MLKIAATIIIAFSLLACGHGDTHDKKQQPIGTSFVQATGGHFTLDGTRFRFVGQNAFYLPVHARQFGLQVADNAINISKTSGINVLRIFAAGEGPQIPYGTQPSRGIYSAETFYALDYVISEAANHNIRVIITLVDRWKYWGGMSQYVAWCKNAFLTAVISNDESGDGLLFDEFYRDTSCKNDYKNYINFVLNRVNTITGKKYSEDPTIFSWEIANEPRSATNTHNYALVSEWANEISIYIKSIDQNHMVSIGDVGWDSACGDSDPGVSWACTYYSNTYEDNFKNGHYGASFTRNIRLSAIDYASIHPYPYQWWYGQHEYLAWEIANDFIRDHIRISKNMGAPKPIIIGEYGLTINKMQLLPMDPPIMDDYHIDLYHEAANDWFSIVEQEDGDAVLAWQLVHPTNPHKDTSTVEFSELAPIRPQYILERYARMLNGPNCFWCWASLSGTKATSGDFDNDGKTDIALTGGQGWNTIPVAFSQGDGTFSVTNQTVSTFPVWAAAPGVQVVAGDFNNDGKADLALVGGQGWNEVRIAFSTGGGNFSITNNWVNNFPSWATAPGARAVAGDFNGDGLSDIALTGGLGWWTIPVAFSQGDGTFNVTNETVPTFPVWATAPGVQVVAGDFNYDGKADLALVGGQGWNDIRVALSIGNGNFSTINYVVNDFPVWATAPGVRAVAGDFNGDNRSDIALTGGGPNWYTIPIAFSTGTGFNPINNAVENFPTWSTISGAQTLAGDFKGDPMQKRSHLALVGGYGWVTIPVAFSLGNGSFNIVNMRQ